MFDIQEKDVMGQTNRLLYNIWQELKKPQEAKPAEELKRADLMAMVKQLNNKPQGWTKLSNDELKKLIKDGEDK